LEIVMVKSNAESSPSETDRLGTEIGATNLPAHHSDDNTTTSLSAHYNDDETHAPFTVLTRSVQQLSAHHNGNEALVTFEVLQLEGHGWYWNLGLLVFSMAILIAADLLYNFPSPTYQSWGTDNLARAWRAIVVEYVIWFGLIVLILFMYTGICLTFNPRLGQRYYEHIFGGHSKTQYIVLKVLRYAVLVLLLAGTAAFDVFMYYAPDTYSRLFGQLF
jgi:hypothetical protein